MILSFSKQNIEERDFENKILNGTKIHTIQEDKPNRWKPGNKIHFATGVRTKNYNCFKEGVCKSVQKIEIKWHQGFWDGIPTQTCDVYIDGRMLRYEEVVVLAKNDGFDCLDDFLGYFDKDFTGKIIHWTDYKY